MSTAADWRSDLAPLLDFRSAAIVGISPRGGYATGLYQNLRQGGFRGPIYLVNPKYDEVLGQPCYPSLAALPERVDCVFISLPAARVVDVVRDAGEAGIPAAVVFATGFVDAGTPEGKAMQEELIRVARHYGIRLQGPNCMGHANVRTGAMGCGYHMPAGLQPGGVAFLSQSGLVFWSVVHNTRDIRFNYVVSCGNEAVLGLGDYMRYILADPETRVIGLWVEGLRDVPGFLEACALAREKGVPVVALKVGRSSMGEAMARAHSGALAGSDKVYDAIFRKHGVIRVRNLNEFLDTLELLGSIRSLPAEGLGGMTDSGGERALMTDLAEDLGLRFPACSPEGVQRLSTLFPGAAEVSNPIDIWSTGQGAYEDLLGLCFDTFSDEPEIGLCIVGLDMLNLAPDTVSYADCTIRYHLSGRKPVAVIANLTNALDETQVARIRAAGVPVLRGTEDGLRAVRHLIDWQRFLRRPITPVPAPVPGRRAQALDLLARCGDRKVLTEAESKALLTLYDIPSTRERLVRTADEAVAAAADIGYPVAAKICSPRFPHKTEVGGVKLALRDEAAVRAACADLLAILGKVGEAEGVLVQEMVGGGVEALAGMSRDAQFGPVLTVGSGGILVELIKDVRLLVPPVTAAEVLAELEELKLHKLLNGFRGRPKADSAALARAMAGLSDLAIELGDQIAEIDINPLMIMPDGQGVRVADALVICR